MKKVLLIGVAIGALTAGPALAADLRRPPITKAPPAPMAPPVAIWTGCYIGGNVGGAWSSIDTTVNGGAAAAVNNDADGWFGGGQVGCDYQFNNNWVIGAEVQGSWADISGTATDGFSGLTVDNKINWFVTATGRLGYAVNSLLFYAKGGAAWADFDYRSPSMGTSVSDTQVGWTVGGGVEWMLAPNWSAKLEYQYLDFGKNSVGLIPGFATDVDAQVHTVKVGLNWRFGGPGGGYPVPGGY